MIYALIEEKDESRFKIGYAKSVGEEIDIEAAIRRARGYQTGNPRDLYVVAAMPGSRRKEGITHHELRQHRLGGEWFAAGLEVLAWIERWRLPSLARVRGSVRQIEMMPVKPDALTGLVVMPECAYCSDLTPGACYCNTRKRKQALESDVYRLAARRTRQSCKWPKICECRGCRRRRVAV